MCDTCGMSTLTLTLDYLSHHQTSRLCAVGRTTEHVGMDDKNGQSDASILSGRTTAPQYLLQVEMDYKNGQSDASIQIMCERGNKDFLL